MTFTFSSHAIPSPTLMQHVLRPLTGKMVKMAGISLAVAIATVVLAPMTGQSVARADELKLTTLEWPPYSGSMTGNGVSTEVVRAILEPLGHTVVVESLPWQRAVLNAREAPGFAGYFPEYTAEIEGFTMSPSIGQSPLGLIIPAGKEVADTTPAALAGLKLGVVNGYVNAAPVAEAISAKGLKPEGVVDDTTNIKKVAAGRIDAAEIDRFAFEHLMANSADLKPLADKIAFGPVLEIKTLHIAFNTGEEGRKWAAIFADAVKSVDVAALQAKFLKAP